MDSKHNCIDCARASKEDNFVICNINLPVWVQRPVIRIVGNECVSCTAPVFMVNDCPAWYPNTPPQWTLPEWKKEGEYAVLSGVTHNGKRWECFKENGGKYGDAVEPGTDPNVWRESK